jgi:hypothetical protein
MIGKGVPLIGRLVNQGAKGWRQSNSSISFLKKGRVLAKEGRACWVSTTIIWRKLSSNWERHDSFSNVFES